MTNASLSTQQDCESTGGNRVPTAKQKEPQMAVEVKVTSVLQKITGAKVVRGEGATVS